MSNYRPICDYWLLARCKHKYFGGYPAGFLSRARDILVSANPNAAIWYIPGGMAHKYNGAGGMPLKGYGQNDLRIDIRPECEPEILMDVRELDKTKIALNSDYIFINASSGYFGRPDAIIIDRPYSEEMSKEYLGDDGPAVFPELNKLLKDCLRIVKPFGLVGVLDWKIPSAKSVGAKCLYRIAVDVGDGSQIRSFTVWQKLPDAVTQPAEISDTEEAES
jgi:hypothetical protein